MQKFLLFTKCFLFFCIFRQVFALENSEDAENREVMKLLYSARTFNTESQLHALTRMHELILNAKSHEKLLTNATVISEMKAMFFSCMRSSNDTLKTQTPIVFFDLVLFTNAITFADASIITLLRELIYAKTIFTWFHFAYNFNNEIYIIPLDNENRLEFFLQDPRKAIIQKNIMRSIRNSIDNQNFLFINNYNNVPLIGNLLNYYFGTSIQEVVKMVFIVLKSQYVDVQEEAKQTLLSIANSSIPEAQNAVLNDAIPEIVHYLDTQPENWELVFKTAENLIKLNPIFRDEFIKERMITILSKYVSNDELKNAYTSWILTSIYAPSYISLPYESYKMALPLLYQLLNSNEKGVATNTMTVFKYFVDNNHDKDITKDIKVDRLLSMYNSNDNYFQNNSVKMQIYLTVLKLWIADKLQEKALLYNIIESHLVNELTSNGLKGQQIAVEVLSVIEKVSTPLFKQLMDSGIYSRLIKLLYASHEENYNGLFADVIQVLYKSFLNEAISYVYDKNILQLYNLNASKFELITIDHLAYITYTISENGLPEDDVEYFLEKIIKYFDFNDFFISAKINLAASIIFKNHNVDNYYITAVVKNTLYWFTKYESNDGPEIGDCSHALFNLLESGHLKNISHLEITEAFVKHFDQSDIVNVLHYFTLFVQKNRSKTAKTAVKAGAYQKLIKLLKSTDKQLARNAAGAISVLTEYGPYEKNLAADLLDYSVNEKRDDISSAVLHTAVNYCFIWSSVVREDFCIVPSISYPLLEKFLDSNDTYVLDNALKIVFWLSKSTQMLPFITNKKMITKLSLLLQHDRQETWQIIIIIVLHIHHTNKYFDLTDFFSQKSIIKFFKLYKDSRIQWFITNVIDYSPDSYRKFVDEEGLLSQLFNRTHYDQIDMLRKVVILSTNADIEFLIENNNILCILFEGMRPINTRIVFLAFETLNIILNKLECKQKIYDMTTCPLKLMLELYGDQKINKVASEVAAKLHFENFYTEKSSDQMEIMIVLIFIIFHIILVKEIISQKYDGKKTQ